MTEASRFLRLAPEIRDQIYGYLLSITYTKHYPSEEDPVSNSEWEYNPGFTSRYSNTPRPTHVYRFHVGILGTNRQINCEASNVLYDRNLFVRLTWHIMDWDINFQQLGVPVVAQGATASRFVYTVLHIEVKTEQLVCCASDYPLQLIFAGADLPAFCTALLIGGEPILGSSLSIDLNCNTADEINKFRASFTTTALKNLIEPLHLLHSFQFAYITGPLDEKYKSDLCLSICKEAPSFQESSLKVLHKVQGLKALGTQRNMTYYRQAISTYNTVMTELKDRCSRLDWATQARIGANTASIADLRVHNAYTNLVFMLRTNLATSHFQIGQYWQARKWSEHAMEIVNERWNPLAINYQADPRYLKALLFNARSNNKLGRWKEAVYSMEKAVEIAPSRTKELELFKGDEKRHAEKQLKTVKRFW